MTDFSNATLANFNQTLLLHTSLCTLSTCPLVLDGKQLAHLTYLPNLGGNEFYIAIFVILILLQTAFGIRYRTWGYWIGMFGGLLCEIIGYIARIMMNSNPFSTSNFIMYLVCLTIGPAFLTASIYLCLSRIIIIYCESAARFRARYYTYFFIFCDVVSLVLQAAGGGITSGATTVATDQMGKNLLIAGLAFQVASLTVFAILCADLVIAFHKVPESACNPEFVGLRKSKKLRYWFCSLSASVLFIYIRSCFRVAELSQGFKGTLANSEITFMILEGAMIVLATLLLTVLHPGLVLGRGGWAAADFRRLMGGEIEMKKPANNKFMPWRKTSGKSERL